MKEESNREFLNENFSLNERISNLIEQLTWREKLALLLHRSPAIKRLDIPEYNWWNEALHGVARAGITTVFPQPIGLAATFNPGLIKKVALLFLMKQEQNIMNQ